MERARKIIEIESLTENLLKSRKNAPLLRLKVLYFTSVYQNLSVSMIIEKLGIKKSNFALLTSELEKEGLVEINQAEIDRRCRTMRLTEKGREELEKYESELESSLGATSMEVDKALGTIIDFMNKII
jgi:DNA-binding MarR family transcriptional regulator